MLWEHALEPDEEEVGQVRVGNRIIVRRISEPDGRGLVGQRMRGGVGSLDVPDRRAGPGFDDLGHPVEGALVAAGRIPGGVRFGEVPHHH